MVGKLRLKPPVLSVVAVTVLPIASRAVIVALATGPDAITVPVREIAGDGGGSSRSQPLRATRTNACRPSMKRRVQARPIRLLALMWIPPCDPRGWQPAARLDAEPGLDSGQFNRLPGKPVGPMPGFRGTAPQAVTNPTAPPNPRTPSARAAHSRPARWSAAPAPPAPPRTSPPRSRRRSPARPAGARVPRT